MDYSGYEFLDIEVDEGVALVKIGKPNARSHEQHEEYPRCLRDFAVDDDVRVVVATGTGDNFAPGASYESIEYRREHLDEELAGILRRGRDLTNAHIDLEKPFITALNGWSWGSGTVFSLFGDFIIAERHVRFGDGHIATALAAGDGGCITWPLSVGIITAKKYLMTADWISAEEAERIGLITEVVDTGASLSRSMDLARRLAAGPQQAIRLTKRALNQYYRWGNVVSGEYSLAAEGLTFHSTETDDAVRSLRGGRGGAIDRSWRWARR